MQPLNAPQALADITTTPTRVREYHVMTGENKMDMTVTFDPSAHFGVDQDVVESRLGEETVILHLKHGIYFGLDKVATLIWERLQAGETIGAIRDYVRASFDAVPDTLDREVNDFLQVLLEKELIRQP